MRLENTGRDAEKGVTLIELVVVIAITGILATTLIKMYQVAILSFQKSSRQSIFLNHATRFVQQISKDIYEANRIELAAKKKIILIGKKSKIQYSFQENGKNVIVIRKIQPSRHSDWIQQPRFPVAEFPILDNNDKPVVTFKRRRNSQLDLNISSQDRVLETTITCRSDE